MGEAEKGTLLTRWVMSAPKARPRCFCGDALPVAAALRGHLATKRVRQSHQGFDVEVNHRLFIGQCAIDMLAVAAKARVVD